MKNYDPKMINALAKEFGTTPQSIVYCLDNQDTFPFFSWELKLEYNYLQRKWKI